MARDALIGRVERLEAQLRAIEDELVEVRALLATDAESEPAEPPAAAPAPAAPVAVTVTVGLARAWELLERGDAATALAIAEEELDLVAADPAALGELEAFARTATWYSAGDDRRRAEALAARCAQAAEPAAVTAPAAAAPTAPAAPAATVAAAAQGEPEQAEVVVPEAPASWEAELPRPVSFDAPRRGLGDRVRAELTGARVFALAGGVVTLLGILFLFVLAANRGWIGPSARVAMGAAASAALLIAGLVLRHRFGRSVAGLAAVGTGIAGAYATLAAATVLYELLPAVGALVAAAGIAAVGAAVAIAWSSELLAGLALVGGAAAPAALALDHGIDWPGTAFAVVVLAAAVAVATDRRWLWLESAVAVVAAAQVLWLAAVAPTDDLGSIVVGVLAALVLLGAAVAWQAGDASALDGPAATLALAGAGLALAVPFALVRDETALGLLLCALAVVFGAVAVVTHRRFPDLGWTIGAGALLLAGVGTASLLDGRSLTVVWAIESVVLMGLAQRLGAPRFALASLAYLTGAAAHALATEVVPTWPSEAFDVPRSAAAGLFVLAAASLVAGLLLPSSRRDAPSAGVATPLDRLWVALVAGRVALRVALAGVAAVSLASGIAALVSGRSLTVVVALVSIALAAAAYLAAERRLSPFALGFLGFAAVHALAVEAPPSTLTLESSQDAAAPIPSLVVLAAAALVLTFLHRFEQRGIPFLGEPSGLERRVELLQRHGAEVQRLLVAAAVALTSWALGLLAIDASYAPGQVIATALWATLGTAVVVLASRAAQTRWQLAGFAVLAFATSKALEFDWARVGDGWAATSALVVAVALLSSGFGLRWLDRSQQPFEVVAVGTGALAAGIAFAGLERVLPIDTRALGVAAIAITVVEAAVGVLPYRRWRAGAVEAWPRTLANGYWATALAMLLIGEVLVVGRDRPATLALWALTGGALALVARPLGEERAWYTGLGVVGAAACLVLVLETTPDRLLEASAHPGSALWVLAAVCAAAWAVAATAPATARPIRGVLAAVAAGLTLYGLSLGVLELAVRVSGASETTDFQRGHTALSALWGLGALALYVVGLSRDRRELRLLGLTLFGLAGAKLFLYDLSTLSSITRALSFILVGIVLLTAGYFAERLVHDDDVDAGATPEGRS